MITKDVYNSKTHKKAFNFTTNHSISSYLTSNKKNFKSDNLLWSKYGEYGHFHCKEMK